MDKGIFRIEGHTDSRGGDALNQALSERRAEAVVSYLAEAHAVSTSRLEVVGYGETRPLVPDDPEAAANRRVEVRRLGSLP
jgi:outer membrane protein OmpA-like peptidoglycan-associated protein